MLQLLLRLHSLSPPGASGGYIPYRDSKLTRLLQPSLGGNAKITIICTATGALLSSDETHNTLKFANRAKRMKNHAAINEVSNEKVGNYRNPRSAFRLFLPVVCESQLARCPCHLTYVFSCAWKFMFTCTCVRVNS